MRDTSRTNQTYSNDSYSQNTTKCKWGKCTKVSTSRANLVNNCVSHINFVCGICHLCDGKTFKWKLDYRKHMRVKHTPGEQVFLEAVAILLNDES